MGILLSLALLPVFFLLIFIYRKDSTNLEPVRMIIKAFFFGLFSCFVSLTLTSVLPDDLKAAVDELVGFAMPQGIFGFIDAFVSAALPEEFAKLLMLWLLLRKSKHFDEPMDGIVYSACVSLGFAALENVFYLIDEADLFSTGIMRGLFSVPGHFCFAVAMGYYYSKAHFGTKHKMLYRLLAYFIPVFLHGVYDGLITIMDGDIWYLVFIVWLAFCILTYKKALKRINKLKAPNTAYAKTT